MRNRTGGVERSASAQLAEWDGIVGAPTEDADRMLCHKTKGVAARTERWEGGAAVASCTSRYVRGVQVCTGHV